jgi:hypothetical protein
MWSKPGYGISITVPMVHKDAITSIQNTLRTEEFELKSEKEFYVRDLFSYSKDITNVAKKVDHPYILLTLSYDKVKGQIAEQVTSFKIGMGNEWDGQQPQLKQEMDRTADILISELTKIIGKENIIVERTAIGPPF